MRRSAIKCSAADVNSILAESRRCVSRLNYLTTRLCKKQRGGGREEEAEGAAQVLDAAGSWLAVRTATCETTGADKMTPRLDHKEQEEEESSRDPSDLRRRKPNPRGLINVITDAWKVLIIMLTLLRDVRSGVSNSTRRGQHLKN